MLREAAEKGYDRLSWTTGDQQADRYDLSHHIGRVQYDPDANQPNRNKQVLHRRRKPRHTTHHQHLPQRVTVTRVRHPFEGKSLAVWQSIRRKGRMYLVLILPDGSKSMIPRSGQILLCPHSPSGLPLPLGRKHSARSKTCFTHVLS